MGTEIKIIYSWFIVFLWALSFFIIYFAPFTSSTEAQNCVSSVKAGETGDGNSAIKCGHLDTRASCKVPKRHVCLFLHTTNTRPHTHSKAACVEENQKCLYIKITNIDFQLPIINFRQIKNYHRLEKLQLISC